MENEKKQDGGAPHTTVIVQQAAGSGVGICALVFGVISIFFLSPLFVPLSVIMAVIAIMKKQIGWGIGALVCAAIGLFTSPILMTALGFASFR